MHKVPMPGKKAWGVMCLKKWAKRQYLNYSYETKSCLTKIANMAVNPGEVIVCYLIEPQNGLCRSQALKRLYIFN